jgi:hypothetical protein
MLLPSPFPWTPWKRISHSMSWNQVLIMKSPGWTWPE